jgi:glutamyl-tRNA reductase
MNGLTLFHRSKELPGALPLGVGPAWATCLREMAFLADDVSQVELHSVKNIEIYRNEEALLFLLETLCGLKSPILGETEVMGQFKSYLSQIDESHVLRRDTSLLPFLMSTVKEARTGFLSATGSLGYGQIVRRWLKDHSDVVLWGYGNLGVELWPWIREKATAVVVKKPRDISEEIPFVIGQSPKASAHIIAAPISNEVVEELAKTSFVIDLRDISQSSPNVRTLRDVFHEIGEMKREREEILPRCREFLRLRVDEYLSRHQIRPFGWEDLCG